MNGIAGTALMLPGGLSESGIDTAVTRSRYGGSQIGTQTIYILSSDGSLRSYKTTGKDGVFEPSSDADAVMDAVASGTSTGSSEKIVQISPRGSNLLCRTDRGRLVTVDAVHRVVARDSNVIRITEYGVYKDKMKYFKSGPGTESLIPLIEDNILSIYPQNGYDAKVILDENDNFRVKIDRNGTLQDTDQSRAVAGVLGDAVCYRDGNTYFIEGGGIDQGAADFGFVSIETPSLIGIRSSCCFAPSPMLHEKMLEVLPQAFAEYVYANGSRGGCAWHGVGNVGHVIDICLDTEGFSYTAQNKLAHISGKYPYYVDLSGVLHIIGGVSPMNVTHANMIQTALSDVGAAFFTEDGRQNFCTQSFHGVSFNFGGDRREQMDSAAWQALY
jgi:hypothetical protein